MAVGAATKVPRAAAGVSAFKVSGTFMRSLFVCFVGCLAWVYQAARPPPPKKCGSKGGPPVTASRIKLKDGRYLAYKEFGVPKETAKHKVVFVHGFYSCRHSLACLTTTLSPDIVESKGLYIVSFDRPGYGESDPNPHRTVESTAFDIEELADQLALGSKFYVIGFSMGGQIGWTCLKYIPHRLAGVALLTPAVNYWWRCFPSNLSHEVYKQLPLEDQWALRVFHYLPWLNYFWNTQKLFPTIGIIAHSPKVWSRRDLELFHSLASRQDQSYLENSAQATQQGNHESLHRDLAVGFGTWDFDPTELKNPFPEIKGVKVHLWQGDDDLLVPVALQRYIARQLPWIQYHELAGFGHMFPCFDGMADKIFESLLA